jgi:hypothetical protein
MTNIDVKAIYKEGQIPDYRNNPLIECLPPIMNYERAAKLLQSYPQYDKEEKDDPKEYRLQYLQRLFDLFQPLSTHLGLLNQFGTLINQGYKGRNPLENNTNTFLNQNYKLIMSGESPINNTYKGVRKVQGFSLIGFSGTGKSTAIDRILSLYPQVIKHTNYEGVPLAITQIPWVKVECPADGSTKSLCLTFFKTIDDLIGTDYFNKWSGGTEGRMLTQMAHLSRLFNIGVIIIDEIQHLMIQKVGGIKKMLNFFVTLVNSIGVPVILIGTNKAFDILGTELRQARRNTGQGNIITSKWSRLEQNTTDWQIMMKRLFKYQWTKKTITPDDDVIDALYVETQGLIDVTVKLFVLSQMIAIVEGVEKLSASLIRRVAKEHLTTLRPMLKALKSGESKELDQFEDLQTSFNEKVTQLRNDLRLNVKSDEEIEKSREYTRELRLVLEEKLLNLTPNRKLIKRAIDSVLKNITITKDTKLEDMYLHTQSYIEKRLTGIKKDSNPDYGEADLRNYRQRSLEMKSSVHQLLKVDGYIKSLYLL